MRAIYSVGLEGAEGHIVTVEAMIRDEKESLVIVGLPDATMKESKKRVLSALHALNLQILDAKITIQLFPSDRQKQGTGFDLSGSEVLTDESIELAIYYRPIMPVPNEPSVAEDKNEFPK